MGAALAHTHSIYICNICMYTFMRVCIYRHLHIDIDTNVRARSSTCKYVCIHMSFI